MQLLRRMPMIALKMTRSPITFSGMDKTHTIQVPESLGGNYMRVPAPGMREITWNWCWRTGTLKRSTIYTSVDGCSSGSENHTMLCLWGWVQSSPR